LIRLAIRVRADRAEQALAELLPILKAGAEEREVDGDVEYSLYAPSGELPDLDDIRELAGDALVGVSSDRVPDGWERRWHQYLRPVRVRDLVVRPPWVEGSPRDLVIDPGVFFGAGTHATTRLCLELLLDAEPGGPLCDWGAGTGVLAIAAARLGWGPVTAVELEEGLIAANAARNGVEVDVVAADLRERAPWAPTIVANLTRGLLLELAPVVPPARMILSGMLAGEADEVVAAYGLREERRLEAEGWAAVALG
jgi:ribosomal protein L11 methyltransferase